MPKKLTKTRTRRPVQRLVGCRPPSAYLPWHQWAEEQYKTGLRQAKCGMCGKWRFPQELSCRTVTSKATTRKNGGRAIVTTKPLCIACAANNQAER
jgi:hypothetical protein